MGYHTKLRAKTDVEQIPPSRQAKWRISCECTDGAKTLDARPRGHDDDEVIPAEAGIQKPYVQSQTALEVMAAEAAIWTVINISWQC